ncbi:hypothetical protein [Phyllobacterium zundukense]|uniref:Uncharacterized protein n=1 Tax=Phyllobacterium zundukense TaxID=1867719 RepID=A0A2N9W509_9HYPH|nr:hypothetical protein [Phyllobacterium zundukense]ATU91708.1 hypothetical protein BLM14_08790 [Phyllobacterium zundukense]PIO46827.1 hypothetical protein B5P45_03295 [Phyllobacterium zundukense]
MKRILNGLPGVPKDQSEAIERLSMDYAVERTLIAGILAGLAARGLLGQVDFEAIARVGSAVGNSDFSTLLANRIDTLRQSILA